MYLEAFIRITTTMCTTLATHLCEKHSYVAVIALPEMSLINHFVARFAELKDHPDRDVITDLTGMVVNNIVVDNNFAGNVVKIIVDRLKSYSTPAAYKLPIFYLIDSILKRVGGPFAPMFGQHFANEIGSFGLSNAGQRDRGKLEFLFETWRERQFFSLNLVTLMKEALIPMVSESQMQYQQSQPAQHHSQHQQYNSNQNFPVNNSVPSSSGLDRNSSSFTNMVQVEMNALLTEMYNEMNILTNRLTLDQLFSANQSLWMQIKTKAEENTVAKFSNTRQHQHSSQQTQVPITAAGGTRFGAKRSHLEHIVDQMTTSNGMEQPETQNKLARTTMDNTAMNRSSGGSGGNLVFNGNGNTNGSGATSAGSGGNSSSYLDRTFINGFVCEIPVVVDLDRVRGLAGQMADNYQLVPPVMDEHFQEVALAAASRLDTYIQTAMDPPDLPRILFGPLPLEPVTKAGSEALSLVNAEHKPVVHKLPMPEFRTEELGRNPERAVRAMYADRPLQFPEDGLRFATQFDLKQHSEAFIARRLARTRGGTTVRESREWYCSCAQWVSDFNSLTAKDGQTASAAGGGAAVASSSSSGARLAGAAAEEEGADEYIVPADEHFTRCPISREMFETTFDAVEGAMLCRNAVKVLTAPPSLLAAAGAAVIGAPGDMDTAAVFALSRPTEEEPEVRYCIVHKYVLDRWLAQGQAVRFNNAVDRYQQLSSSGGAGANGERIVELLKRAAEAEDEEDLFVKL